jgi:hypothetical protein
MANTAMMTAAAKIHIGRGRRSQEADGLAPVLFVCSIRALNTPRCGRAI